MMVTKRAHWVLALAICGGCAAEAAPPEPDIGATEQAVTVFDCQSQLAQCVVQARSLRDLGGCTDAFAECNAQAVTDTLNEQEILTECRAQANSCLENAITSGDIQACRGIYRTCAESAIATADAVLGNAIDAAEDTIQSVFDTASHVITGAAGATADAFGLLQQCREDAFECLDGVTSSADVNACQVIFDGCATDAVNLVDNVVKPLPGPTPGEIVEGFEECRVVSADCLAGAVTVTDISACRDVFDRCVSNASSLAEGAINDLDDIVDAVLPIDVPTPGDVIDCNTQLSVCLLGFGSPFECASEARACLGL